MKVKTYDDVKIQVIQPSPEGFSPNRVIRRALDITMKADRKLAPNNTSKHMARTLKYLLQAGHTSVLEHVSFTFEINNVSRSFLVQITRHRMSSFTASSQHYQDYRDWPVIVDQSMNDVKSEAALQLAYNSYKASVDRWKIPHEEARQLLPNAAACTILWTINARSLVHFLNIRLCKRNTKEMVNFATKLLHKCREQWHQLFYHVHADCLMKKGCTQGHMSCGRPYGND